MKPLLSDVPVWLCRWKGARARHIPARSAGSAKDLCVLAGLGRPDVISYAGYSAESQSVVRPKGLTSAALATGTSRRAEAALTIYAVLRIDWPIGSILAGFDAESRWQASNGVLRDFIANVGVAIAGLNRTEREVLEQVVTAQALYWWHSAQESNAHRIVRTCSIKDSFIYQEESLRDLKREAGLTAEHHRKRRDLYHHQARLLRKRRSYAMAVGQLSAALDGRLPKNDEAAGQLTEILVEHGFEEAEAQVLVARYRRVTVPRL